MQQYQFQYTKMWDTVGIIILAILTLVFTEIFGLYLDINVALTIAISFGLAFLFFQIFKKKVVQSCTATLHESFVEFEFKKSTKLISFSNLISFKKYEGNNGPSLYLKTQNDNFEIFANSNFCKTEKFKIFSDDTIVQLQKHQQAFGLKPSISVPKKQTSVYLYSLIAASVIYILLIIFLDNNFAAYLFIIGGFFLFITWIMYFAKRLITYFRFRNRMVKA